MLNTKEDEGAIPISPIQFIPEIPQEQGQLSKDDIKPKKKPSAPKRTSIEKAVDVSLALCDKMQVDRELTNQTLVTNQLITLLKKEKTKHEELYLLFKVYDKIKEEQELNENSLKNDINYYKNNLLEIQSFLKKKRKPKKDSIELLQNESQQEELCVPIEKPLLPIGNDTMEIDAIINEVMTETIKSKKKSKEKKPKKVKAIKPSLSPNKIDNFIEDMNFVGGAAENNYSSNENAGNCSAEKRIDKADKAEKDKQNSEKKKLVDKSNRSIMNFFQPKMKELPQYKKDVIDSNEPLTLLEDHNENHQFPLIYNNSIITYDIETLPKNITSSVQSYYAIKGEDMTKESLGNYFNDLFAFFQHKKQMMTSHANQTQTKQRRERSRLKILYIHDSFTPNKKIPDKSSSKINPKNPLIKDEYLLDYNKDSEEEFMEENAEDIQSNDNSSDDNEESEDQDINEQWIVPDGHLSEGEISEKEALEDRLLFEKSKPKMGSIMDILEIRKTFNKPIIISFNQKTLDQNHKRLCDKLSMKIFCFDSINLNNNLDCQIEDYNTINSFPLKIEEKKMKYHGVNNTIKSHLTDISNQIHGSFETKEQLIIQLNESFKDISKKGLNNFFKEKCIKLKHNINGKKYWIVKHEILNEVNMTQSDITKLLENHLNEFNEKEKIRLEEKEINRQKNQIEQAKIDETKNNQGDVEIRNENDNNGIKDKMAIEGNNVNDNEGDDKTKRNKSAKKRKQKQKKNEEQKPTQSPLSKNKKKINELFNFN